MADTYSQAFYRGLGLHDEKFCHANTDLSGATQAGPEPDQPTATTRGFMETEAHGSAVAGAKKNVVTVKPGAPIGGTKGGRHAWKDDADGATSYRGWLNYNKPTGFDNVRFVSSGVGHLSPHAITLPDHRVLVSYHSTTGDLIESSALDPTNDVFDANVTIADQDSLGDGVGTAFSCMVRLPDGSLSKAGRILCFYILLQTRAATDYWRLGFAYSDNNGASWTEGGRFLDGFDETTSSIGRTAFNRMRAVYHRGYITLVIGGTQSATGTIWHLVSDDLGASFTQVEKLTNQRGRPELWVVPDTGQVGMLYNENAVTDIYYAMKASAFATFADDPSFGSTLFTGASIDSADEDADYAPVIDSEGYLLVFWRNATTNRFRIQFAMYDPANPGAEIFTPWMTSGGSSAISDPADVGGLDTTYLLDFCLTPYKGGLLMFTNYSTQTGTTDETLCYVRFGGYGSLDWQYQTTGYNPTSAFQSGYLYIPIELPATLTAWTNAGAGTESVTADGYNLNTSAAARSAQRNGSTAGNPCLVWSRHRSVAGGDLTADDIAIRLRRADGTDDYDVSLRFTATGARLVDNNASATVGTVSGLSASLYYDWLISLEGNDVSTWYKLSTATLWTAGPTSGSLTNDTSTPASGNHVEWGHIASTTSNSIWKMFASCIDGEANATGIAAGLTNPTDLQGRPFSTRQLYLDGGTRIRSTGSAAYVGDAWDIPTRYEFGAQNLDPQISASPDVAWRSTDHNVSEVIRWNPEGVGVDTRMLSSSIVFGVFGTNIATVVLEAYNGSTWTGLGTLDTRVGLTALQFTRSGSWVAPDTGTDHAGTRFVEMDELVGGTLVLDADDSSGNISHHPIERNSEGVWRDDAGRHVELRIDETGATETSGDCEIRAPQAVIVIHNVSTSYEAFRIRIPSQTTAEGYYKIGAVVLGPLALFGWQYSRGRIISEVANVETFEDDAGRRQRRKRGPNRRTAEFAWTEPRKNVDIYDSDPDPEFIRARDNAAYRGIALRQDGTLVAGILRRTDGGVLPVIYLPKVNPATVSTDAFSYASPAKQLYGRIVSEVISTTNVVGDEAQNEMVTHGSILVEGEV